MSEGESQAASSPMARVRHSEERIYTQAGLTLRIDDVRQKEMASLRNRIAALEQIFNQITPPSFEAGPDTEESDEDGPGWNKDSRILCLQSIIDIEYPTGLKFSSGQWKLVAKQNFINTNAHATRVRYHRLKTECGIMRAHRRQQYPNFVYHPSAANTARSNKEPEHGARTRAARAAQIDEPDDSDEEHSDRAAEGEIQVSRRKKAPKQDNGELAISVGQEDELDADEDADDMDRDGQAENAASPAPKRTRRSSRRPTLQKEKAKSRMVQKQTPAKVLGKQRDIHTDQMVESTSNARRSQRAAADKEVNTEPDDENAGKKRGRSKKPTKKADKKRVKDETEVE